MVSFRTFKVFSALANFSKLSISLYLINHNAQMKNTAAIKNSLGNPIQLRLISLCSLSLFILLWIDGGHCLAQNFAPGELLNGPGFGYGAVNTFDADLDGDLDVLSFPNLYLNDGQGRKQKMVVIGDAKKEYEHYAIRDMDGDKDLDVVVLYKDGEIAFFINEIKGFRKKEQKTKVDYRPSEYAKLYLYDANSDGICDIIVAGLRGVPIAYTGSKVQQFTYFKAFNDHFRNLNDIFGIDLNKDGIQELVVPERVASNGRNCALKVYTFKGTGYVLLNTVALTTNSINNIKLMDMDKDGDQDMVYSGGYPTGGIYWLERDAKGGLGKIHTLISPLELEDFQLGDFDADGDLDVAYFTRQNQYSNINWLENKGKNVLVKSPKSLLPNIKGSQTFVFEDFDGDKIKDVLFYNDDNEQLRPKYEMVLQQKNGLVKARHTWMVKADCAGFVVTDLDNNGTKDIVGYYNNELFCILVDGKGKHGQPLTLAKSSFKIDALKCADLDNDGKEDLLIASDDRENGRLGWLRNLGNLKFGNFNVLHSEKERLLGFELIDYDKDGHQDVVINYWTDKIRGFYIYRNMGKGIFSNTRNAVMETSTSFPKLGVMDLDGDRSDEVLDHGSNSFFKHMGNGKWEQQKSPFQERFIKGIYPAKLDGNKLPDYMVHASGPLKKFELLGNGQWEGKEISGKFSMEMMRVGDINGDGYDDIVAVSESYGLAPGYNPELSFSSSYMLICLINDGSGNFVQQTLYPVSNLSNIELLDVDKDGDLDIITAGHHWPEGGIKVWKNLGKH